MKTRAMGVVGRVAAVVGAVLATGGAWTAGPVMAEPAAKPAKGGGSLDRLTLRSGRVIEGKVLSESDTEVKVRIVESGIEAETTFSRDAVLAIEKGVVAASPAAAAEPAAGAVKASPSASPAKAEAAPGSKKVYRIPLTGKFGRDISQKPLKDAMKDAQRQGADVVVLELDNDWSHRDEGGIGDRGEEESSFDELWRAVDMKPVVIDDVRSGWNPPPKVVFWVKKAMGGAAFLPLVSDTIYMTSTAKMGGVGRVERLFGSTGDEVVREKQISLRVSRVEGLAQIGGYDPLLVRAMVRTEQVLSYKMEGGRPVFVERMPEADDEVLLTDDGKETREDTEIQLAREEGNDNLTLKPDAAFKLGISKGTVDTFEDLMAAMGYGRNYAEIEGRGKRIMEDWKKEIAAARRTIPRLWREYGEIQVDGGTPAERNADRGRQRRKLDELQAVLRKYEEAINAGQLGVPDVAQIDVMKRQIEADQLADRQR